MQAAQVTLKQYRHEARIEPHKIAGTIANWLTRVFGCWHTDMSRPFTLNGESFRACLDCGAHRKFDTASWEMNGAYYYSLPQRGQ